MSGKQKPSPHGMTNIRKLVFLQKAPVVMCKHSRIPESDLKDRDKREDDDTFVYPEKIFPDSRVVDRFVFSPSKRESWTLNGEESSAARTITGQLIKVLHYEQWSNMYPLPWMKGLF